MTPDSQEDYNGWCWDCHEPKVADWKDDRQPHCPDCNDVVSTL